MLYKQLLKLFNKIEYLDRFKDNEHYFLFEKYEGEKLCNYLKDQNIVLKGLSVLDLGCGCGGIIEGVDDAKLKVGLDSDKTRILTANELSNAQFTIADGHNLCFSDSCFDLVMMNSVIEHVADPEKLMQEVKRVLKPFGTLYMSTCSIYSMWGGHIKPPFAYMPYIHLLPNWLTNRYMAYRLKKVSEPVKKELEGSGYLSLNNMTIKRLMELIEKTPWLIEHRDIRLSLLYDIPYLNRIFRFALKNATLREFFSGEVKVICKKDKI